ncbi:MAG: hypothetical protein LBR38_01755, partial [Synergistaceae bacterium]|nr:hypothetical protein [Synergistaceae bacterium]
MRELAPRVVGLFSFAVTMVLFRVFIIAMSRLGLRHRQKTYGVGVDLDVKEATPTMGGVVFMLIALLMLCWRPSDWPFWSLPIACGFVGLADDLLKLIRGSSEGLRSMEKLVAQMLVAAIWLACVHPSSLALFPALLGGVVLLLASVGMVN